ncbi:MAG TPA: TonB-dependent receptor [Acidobacteriaceae bacterium]|nr:TonB-dependent receptor [Acidobacteriaceae bacterium]
MNPFNLAAFPSSHARASLRCRLHDFMLAWLLVCVPWWPGQAQQGSITGTIVDARDQPVAGAQIQGNDGHLITTSAADGSFTVPAGTHQVQVVDPYFEPKSVDLEGASPVRVLLEHPLESVTVTAYRSPLASGDSPASTRILNTQQLRQAAGISLDDKLRQVPGFELFRRTSSLVANPTTEGVSLRGLGSTAASRSLVVFDEIPILDAFGGWVHWEEFPPPVIHSVELVRGGASDLYGSSAIGGVISIVPVRPTANRFQLNTSYGSEATTDNSLLGALKFGQWSGLLSSQLIATDGYILTAPSVRGPIDQPYNVHAQNGLTEFDHGLSHDGRIFLRGGILNENRHNGTPIQINSTRLYRYAGGADWSNLVLRLYGDTEHYSQTFSTINASRTGETLTRIGKDPADELGALGHWHQPIGTHLLVLAGADLHDVRAADYETNFPASKGYLNTSAHQRQGGVYGEVLFTPKAWTLSASGRVDHFSNFDARQYKTGAAPVTLPQINQTVFDPRIGITRRLTTALALNASAFRAFRAPTENELYRTGQVGSQTTLPNPNLLSERATGWEAGIHSDLSKIGTTVRVSYFWTQINRPITALTLSTTATSTLLMRENLGQIESRGISLDYASRPLSWVSIEGGYQYADATVTKNSAMPSLVGNWIPQVARNMTTAQVNFSHRRLGLLSVQGRYSGRQYDDDANQFLLHGYFRLGAYASHDFGHHLSVFAAGDNLFDRSIQAGKTPVLTLASPRVARFGLRINFGE